MDMTGERRIPAPRQRVWTALNDPEVLRACIPGCQTLEKTSDTDMTATAAIKIGPISARFSGKVTLSDLDPPNGYRISGEGQGGVAGFAKGGASVKLAEEGAFTLLTYAVNAQVGGKIAQLGARLIDSTAKSMADQFFDRFTNAVSTPAVAEDDTVSMGADGPAAVIAALTPGPVDYVPSGGAKTPVEAHERAMHPNSVPATLPIWAMIPERPFGLPRVAVGGMVVWAVIFVMIFKGYVGL